jgi:hypothetical protein
VIPETAEKPEPRSFNFKVFEVTSAAFSELVDENEESPEWEEDCEARSGGSTKLDFKRVETNDKSTSSVEDARVNEVEGIFDKTSVLVWGMEVVKLDRDSIVKGERELTLELDWDSELACENDSCWILVRNIVFTESMDPWPSTSWLAMRSVKFSKTINRSTFEEDASASRTWTIATEFKDPKIEVEIESGGISNDWAWLNERESKSNTGPLEEKESSEGERVTDDRDESKDNTFPSLTSLSADATLSKPATSWDRISRRVDISESVVAQSSPVKSASQEQIASQALSMRPQAERISPDSEFINWHTPWPEQSVTLHVLLFITHKREEQLSQLAQSEFELQLMEAAPGRSTKLDSFTHNELSFPDTPT